MHVLRGMNITANKKEVLETLEKNRNQHKVIVGEARAGYFEKAQKALELRLAQLKEGKLVSLSFRLQPPVDHTDVYDTAITMLEMHREDTIVLDSDMARSLIQDKWEWADQFLHSNAIYSKTASDRIGAAFDPNE